jgi:Kef-type K+ transport system membrane component KefB
MFDGSIDSAVPVVAVCAIALGGLYGVTTRRGLVLILLGSLLSLALTLEIHFDQWLMSSKKGVHHGRTRPGRGQRGAGGS